MASKTLPSCFSHFLSILLIVCVHVTLTVKIQPGIFELNFMDYLSTSVAPTENAPELAIGNEKLTPGKYYHAVMKSAFAGTPVCISIISGEEESNKDVEYSVGWEIRYTQCEGLYGNAAQVGGNDFIQVLYNQHKYMFSVEDYIFVQNKEDDPSKKRTEVEAFPKLSSNGTCYVIKLDLLKNQCSEGEHPEEDNEDHKNEDVGDSQNKDVGDSQNKDVGDSQNEDGGASQNEDGGASQNEDGGDPQQRKRRDETPEGGNDKGTDGGASQTKGGSDSKSLQNSKTPVANTHEDGNHLVIIQLHIHKGEMTFFKVKVDMKGTHGYLSAFQYPLLQFYGIMCGLYILLGFTWLFLLCYQYKDLLGIQIWIGAVIFLGLVEKAVFFAEFEHVNNYGEESQTGVLFPELVSCLKRTLARLLVVVVSIGYGITRPRLGNDLNYIMAAGLLYMVLSSAEAIIRTSNENDHSVAAILPLSVLDAVLVWWIFRNLVDTTRTLRLRQNEVKLWLYRHFTNTLLLCIVLSVIFFLWSLKTHSFNECIIKWHELWLDDAFWHILFCVILVAVMVLFRPSINNQRYAYSPLLDDEENQDEGSKEPMLSDAYDGMKMRNLKKDSPQNAVNEIDDDLKWVEDNIPAAIADSALSMMDDSEEELVTNLERSKMD